MTRTENILLGLAALFLAGLYLVIPFDQGAALEVQTLYAPPCSAAAEAEATASPDALWLSLETRIDLNHAGAEELTALPGIGPVLAARIVAYREEHGPFASPEELLAIEGIGEAVVDRLCALAVIENDS